MNIRKTAVVLSLLMAFAAGYFAGTQDDRSGVAHAQANARVFELRTYTAHPGKLGEVVARFRDDTARIFAKNGITSVGYFTPQDAPLAGNTLVYILAHPAARQRKRTGMRFARTRNGKR